MAIQGAIAPKILAIFNPTGCLMAEWHIYNHKWCTDMIILVYHLEWFSSFLYIFSLLNISFCHETPCNLWLAKMNSFIDCPWDVVSISKSKKSMLSSINMCNLILHLEVIAFSSKNPVKIIKYFFQNLCTLIVTWVYSNYSIFKS